MKKQILVVLLFLILFVNVYARIISEKERDVLASIFDSVRYELVVIYCGDDTVFCYTEEQGGSVFLRISWLKNKLKKLGKTMDDIKIIAHKHLSGKEMCRHFSPADRKQLQLLKNQGFKGLYILWVDGEVAQEIK